jgi:hypothetical protein
MNQLKRNVSMTRKLILDRLKREYGMKPTPIPQKVVWSKCFLHVEACSYNHRAVIFIKSSIIRGQIHMSTACPINDISKWPAHSSF